MCSLSLLYDGVILFVLDSLLFEVNVSMFTRYAKKKIDPRSWN